MASGYRYAVMNEVDSLAKSVRQQVHTELTSFLTQQRTYITDIAPELVPVADAMEEYLLEGGKRLRPLFAYAGFIATGATTTLADIRAMASLELLQACALIHDDLMDGSDSRRGRPSIHRRFESNHVSEKLVGDPVKFGASAAILLGDLALVWSDQMLHSSAISAESLLAVLRVHDEMRVELMAGQFLDVREAGENKHSVAKSLQIARYKSGKYTIERPLHFGATIARPELPDGSEFLIQLSRYGIPLGEAFQMRDDILGVFGNPEETGKPAGDDLREGKRTALIALALEKADASGQAKLSHLLGSPDLTQADVDTLRTIINDSGAVVEIESLIERLFQESQKAIESEAIADSAKEFLTVLAHRAVQRSA